jgi:hypothetical protein
MECDACMQAVSLVFPGGHANVQAQGSAAKGTNTHQSDWDLFVRMTAGIDFCTQQQRVQCLQLVMDGLERAGIHYNPRLGEHRIQLRDGCNSNGVSLPDVDIVFERFKGSSRPPDEPNREHLALSPHAGHVVRHLKAIPEVYTNLRAPSPAHYLERYVVLVESMLRCQVRDLHASVHAHTH